MAQNIGTLVTAAIRPNDSLDLIASAFANEVKGGLHSVTSSTDRNSIIAARREWGMMCYVVNDDKTYQLTYGYNAGSTNLTDNLNWKEFQSGSGGSGSSEWLDSVISVETTEPVSPNNGDRYIVGLNSSASLSGTNWGSLIGGKIAQWNGYAWSYTIPNNNTSVRVDSEDNAIYRYMGTYSTGTWYKEKESQVRYIYATSSNGEYYTADVTPYLGNYDREIVYITKFDSVNTGASVSLNIAGLGYKRVKKVDGVSLTNLTPGDLSTNYQYILTYDGTDFEVNLGAGGTGSINNRYFIESTEQVIVPVNQQYWIYGDLTIDGTLENYGQVVIANGSLNTINSGQFINGGTASLIYFAEINGLGQTNFVPRWENSYVLTATSSITDDGNNVSITGNTFSINADIIIPQGAYNNYVLTSDSSGVATWQPNIGMKFSATYSLLDSVTQSVTHSLNTKDIVVNVWNEITGDLLITTVKRTSDNTIDILATTGTYSSVDVRVVIIS